MTHPDRVDSRGQLLDRVWGGNVYVEERHGGRAIRRLRRHSSLPAATSRADRARRRLSPVGAGGADRAARVDARSPAARHRARDRGDRRTHPPAACALPHHRARRHARLAIRQPAAAPALAAASRPRGSAGHRRRLGRCHRHHRPYLSPQAVPQAAHEPADPRIPPPDRGASRRRSAAVAAPRDRLVQRAAGV